MMNLKKEGNQRPEALAWWRAMVIEERKALAEKHFPLEFVMYGAAYILTSSYKVEEIYKKENNK